MAEIEVETSNALFEELANWESQLQRSEFKVRGPTP